MAETKWLSTKQLRAWMKLEGITQLLPGVLDAQLQHAAGLTHFDYLVLAKLSEAPGRTLRMTDLASETNATLPRLSHVVSRLMEKGFVRKETSAEDRRANLAVLTESGWEKVVTTAPGHVESVRRHVIDVLDDTDISDLDRIGEKILRTLDPNNRLKVRCEE